MKSRHAPAQRRFRIALAISLLLHAIVLFYGYLLPYLNTQVPLEPRPREAEPPRIQAMLVLPRNRGEPVPPEQPRPPAPPPSAPKPKPTPPSRVLSVPSSVPSAPTWTRQQREEMEKFLEEEARKPRPPAPPSTPPSGQQLAQRALLLAGRIAREAEADPSDERPSKTNAEGKAIEPLSMEMYIAAFIQKLNRGAAFVSSTPRIRGQHMGQVQITLNSDGSLRDYRVLRAGDQQAEIAYIKSVIDVASPFAAFPPDLKASMETLSIPICISPRFAGAAGKVFSRSGSKECAS